MANKVKSRWTITFDKGGPNELALCNAGMFLASVIAVGGEQVVEDGDYIEAEDSEPLAMGNVKRPQKIVVHKDHADRETALAWCFAQDLAMAVGITAPLTVEIEGGASYVYRKAAIQRWNFAPMSGGPHRTEATYELKCTSMALESPGGGPPPGPGPQGAVIYLTGTAGVIDAGGDPADHREGVATWENQGTGSDATVPADGGTAPLAIDADGLWLPGIAGNFGRVNHNINFSYGTNFMFRIDVVLPTYRPAGDVCLMSQFPGAPVNVWALFLQPDGKLKLRLSADGTTLTDAVSTVPLPMSPGEYVGIQVVKNNTLVSFYLHGEMDSPLAGMLLGAQVVIANIDPINAGSNLEIGSCSAGVGNVMQGLVQLAAVWQFAAGSPAARDYVNANWARKFTGGFQTGYGDPSGVTVLRDGLDPASLNLSPVLRFDGVNSRLGHVPTALLNAVNGVTIVWKGVLNRVTGTQDLVYCATSGANPRVLLRLNGSGVDVLVRRLDAEATATLSNAAGLTTSGTTTLAVVVSFTAGTVALYSGAGGLTLLAVGTLTSGGGPCSATDSSETRLMSQPAGVNPAAGDVQGIIIDERTYSLAELQAAAQSL